MTILFYRYGSICEPSILQAFRSLNIEVVEEGPVRSTLRIERKFLNSTIVQNIHLYNDIPKGILYL